MMKSGEMRVNSLGSILSLIYASLKLNLRIALVCKLFGPAGTLLELNWPTRSGQEITFPLFSRSKRLFDFQKFETLLSYNLFFF